MGTNSASAARRARDAQIIIPSPTKVVVPPVQPVQPPAPSSRTTLYRGQSSSTTTSGATTPPTPPPQRHSLLNSHSPSRPSSTTRPLNPPMSLKSPLQPQGHHPYRRTTALSSGRLAKPSKPISDPRGFYALLGISPTTDFIDPSRALMITRRLNDKRKALALRYHTDRGGLHDHMAKINVAYDYLSSRKFAPLHLCVVGTDADERRKRYSMAKN